MFSLHYINKAEVPTRVFKSPQTNKGVPGRIFPFQSLCSSPCFILKTLNTLFTIEQFRHGWESDDKRHDKQIWKTSGRICASTQLIKLGWNCLLSFHFGTELVFGKICCGSANRDLSMPLMFPVLDLANLHFTFIHAM